MSKTVRHGALVLAREAPGRGELRAVGRERHGLDRAGQAAQREDLGASLDRADDQLAGLAVARLAPRAGPQASERAVG